MRTALGHTAGVAQNNVMEATPTCSRRCSGQPLSTCAHRRRAASATDCCTRLATTSLSATSLSATRFRLHWRCRSGQVPVLKSHKELGIDIPEILVDGQTRASMDGQVPRRKWQAMMV